MLRYYALPKIQELPAPIFEQDGAPPNYSIPVRNYLDQKFGNNWIGRGGPTAWPPRSPDLTPLDFFLWGYVKDKFYSERIESLDHLKARITDANQQIEPETLMKVWRNAEMRINYVIRQGGGHIEQLDI